MPNSVPAPPFVSPTYGTAPSPADHAPVCSPSPSSPARFAVRVGLSRVFGLAEATGARIVAARSHRPFASLADFSDRVRATLPELEALILAGAFDWTGRSRPSLLLEARVGAKSGAAVRSARGAVPSAALVAADGAPFAPGLAGDDGRPLAPNAVAALHTPELPEFDLAARVRAETQATGLWFSGHPLDLLVPPEAWRGVTAAAGVAPRAGARVVVAGLPCAVRRVETKSGGLMLFLTLADRSGLVECVLFPDAYRRFANAARGQVVRVEGRADETLGAIVVNAERVTALA